MSEAMNFGGEGTMNHHSPQSDNGNRMNRGKEAANIDLLMDVSLRVTVELGRTQMMLRQVLELQNGSVVELDRLAGDPVDIFVNERLIARGEVVVVDDKFGVKITELISSDGVGGR
jgi:flagellar motor switch protein FliN/FliY